MTQAGLSNPGSGMFGGLGRQAPAHATVTLHDMLLFSPVEAAGIMRA